MYFGTVNCNAEWILFKTELADRTVTTITKHTMYNVRGVGV